MPGRAVPLSGALPHSIRLSDGSDSQRKGPCVFLRWTSKETALPHFVLKEKQGLVLPFAPAGPVAGKERGVSIGHSLDPDECGQTDALLDCCDGVRSRAAASPYDDPHEKRAGCSRGVPPFSPQEEGREQETTLQILQQKDDGVQEYAVSLFFAQTDEEARQEWAGQQAQAGATQERARAEGCVLQEKSRAAHTEREGP